MIFLCQVLLLSDSKVKVTQSCPTFWDSEFCRREYWSGWPFPSPGDLPIPEIEPRSPALLADSLPAELKGKPKNTAVGSLSLLQGIFPTQELNQGLLHYRWILYQLSYQGTLRKRQKKEKKAFSPVRYKYILLSVSCLEKEKEKRQH